LQSEKLTNQLPILETFGDIASSIGVHFETYLSVVGQVLQQAATVSVANDVSFDMLEYIISLRSGIVDAWSGIILAFKGTDKGLWHGTYVFERLTN
jgi:importin subunit beta-1